MDVTNETPPCQTMISQDRMTTYDVTQLMQDHINQEDDNNNRNRTSLHGGNNTLKIEGQSNHHYYNNIVFSANDLEQSTQKNDDDNYHERGHRKGIKSNSLHSSIPAEITKEFSIIDDEEEKKLWDGVKPFIYNHVNSPEVIIQEIISGLLSDDWKKQISSLETLQSISLSHPQFLMHDGMIRDLVQSVLHCALSLRSCVSHLGLKTISRLLKIIKEHPLGASTIDIIVPSLLPKSICEKRFVAVAASDCLEFLCQCNKSAIQTKILFCLSRFIGHRSAHSAQMASKASGFVSSTIETMTRNRSLTPQLFTSTILPLISHMLVERQPLAKISARKILSRTRSYFSTYQQSNLKTAECNLSIPSPRSQYHPVIGNISSTTNIEHDGGKLFHSLIRRYFDETSDLSQVECLTLQKAIQCLDDSRENPSSHSRASSPPRSLFSPLSLTSVAQSDSHGQITVRRNLSSMTPKSGRIALKTITDHESGTVLATRRNINTNAGNSQLPYSSPCYHNSNPYQCAPSPQFKSSTFSRFKSTIDLIQRAPSDECQPCKQANQDSHYIIATTSNGSINTNGPSICESELIEVKKKISTSINSPRKDWRKTPQSNQPRLIGSVAKANVLPEISFHKEIRKQENSGKMKNVEDKTIGTLDANEINRTVLKRPLHSFLAASNKSSSTRSNISEKLQHSSGSHICSNDISSIKSANNRFQTNHLWKPVNSNGSTALSSLTSELADKSTKLKKSPKRKVETQRTTDSRNSSFTKQRSSSSRPIGSIYDHGTLNPNSKKRNNSPPVLNSCNASHQHHDILRLSRSQLKAPLPTSLEPRPGSRALRMTNSSQRYAVPVPFLSQARIPWSKSSCVPSRLLQRPPSPVSRITPAGKFQKASPATTPLHTQWHKSSARSLFSETTEKWMVGSEKGHDSTRIRVNDERQSAEVMDSRVNRTEFLNLGDARTSKIMKEKFSSATRGLKSYSPRHTNALHDYKSSQITQQGKDKNRDAQSLFNQDQKDNNQRGKNNVVERGNSNTSVIILPPICNKSIHSNVLSSPSSQLKSTSLLASNSSASFSALSHSSPQPQWTIEPVMGHLVHERHKERSSLFSQWYMSK